MKKILITHKKEKFLVYVLPRKQDTFEKTLDQEISECEIAV